MSEKNDATGIAKVLDDELRNYGTEEGKRRILEMAKTNPDARDFLVQAGAAALVEKAERRAGITA